MQSQQRGSLIQGREGRWGCIVGTLKLQKEEGELLEDHGKVA